jgi:hypothetical protein
VIDDRSKAPSVPPTARHSAISPAEKLRVAVLISPIAYGPRNPPRFPIELISAIPAAAPVMRRYFISVVLEGEDRDGVGRDGRDGADKKGRKEKKSDKND